MKLTQIRRYRALQKVDRQVAIDTFEKHRDFYHPICRGMVEKDLFGKKDA
jgi:leukotriene-A4 hydrolase